MRRTPTAFVCLQCLIFISSDTGTRTVLAEKQTTGTRGTMAHLDSLPRIAPILGESAIVDKETGQVYWQGGRQSLFESTIGHSYLSNQSGILRHVRATLFSCILWQSLVRFLADWALRHQMLAPTLHLSKLTTSMTMTVNYNYTSLTRRILGILRIIMRAILICLTCLPHWPRGFVWLVAAMYLLESYTCSTRRYLVNSLSCPSETELFMEGLREEKPSVRWRIRCYHYERRRWLLCLLLLTDAWNRFIENLSAQYLAFVSRSRVGTNTAAVTTTTSTPEYNVGTGSTNTNTNTNTINQEVSISIPADHDSSGNYNSTRPKDEEEPVAAPAPAAVALGPSLLTRKVISHEIDEHYKIQTWHDDTIGGIWKQAQARTSIMSAFTKIELNKILLFSNAKARIDYFQQQAEFVRKEGGKDAYAEFSTHVDVQGYKQKILAVRSPKGMQKVFNIYFFWLFTFLGLTVPYRIKFSNSCDELRVAVVKETYAGVRREMDARNIESKQSWFVSPKTWFGTSTGHYDSLSLVPQEEERREKFRKHMQEIALYQERVEEKQIEVESLNIDADDKLIEGEEVKSSSGSGVDIDEGKTSLLEKSDEELVAQIVQEVAADVQDTAN